jgi:hypothetical protein
MKSAAISAGFLFCYSVGRILFTGLKSVFQHATFFGLCLGNETISTDMAGTGRQGE